MLQTVSRMSPTMARTISTKHPFEDEPRETPVKGKEGISEVVNAPELLQNGLVVSQIINQLTLRSHSQPYQAQETCLQDEKDGKESPGTPQKYPIERIKINRPPIRPLTFKKTNQTQTRPDPTTMEGPNANSDPRLLKFLNVMAESNSPGLIWHAYQEYTRFSIPIPSMFLDRISRVIVRRYAPTRKTFLRLHEVLHVLRRQGHMKRWQWNSLIYHAALGLRKVHTKDYQAALDIFREMQSMQTEQRCEPDIYTYTTLLSIAIRTGVAENVDHAYSLLQDSNLQQDRIARLAIIPYYIRNRNLKAIRAIAHEFTRRNEDIGIDGINAYTWAFGRHGHLDVVEEIYQALRSNLSLAAVGDESSERVPPTTIDGCKVAVEPTSIVERQMFKTSVDATYPFLEEWYSSISDVDNLVFEFATFNPGAESPNRGSPQMEGDSHNHLPDQPRRFRRARRQVNGDLFIMGHHVPNNITYTLCIQVYAYQNNLRQALQIFRDLITTPDMERPWGFSAQTYRAFHKVYRALFLGFVKHSSSLYTNNYLPSDDNDGDEERQWMEEALEFVFQSFLTMDPEELRPNDRTVGWIMQAFANSSGHNPDKLIWVWRSLEDRFGPLRVPRLYRPLVSPSQAEEPDNQMV
jgi:hypothetical protein